MSGFRDVYLPEQIRGFPFTSSPRFNTTITMVASGSEHRNRNWKHPLHRFQAPEAIKCHEHVEDLRDHWMIMSGPFLTFPFRDPMDFASRRLAAANLAPTIGRADQVIGVGDGFTTRFQLQKKYSRGGFDYYRPIYLPVVATVLVGMNALPPETEASDGLPGGPYDVDVTRYGGELVFDHPPDNGVIITAGFLFDVEIRFESDDSMDAIVQAYQVSGFADLGFWEVRHCNDGVTS